LEYANCSATAQRGALDWRHKFRRAVAPVFDELYQSVAMGEETRIVLKANSAPDYREKLDVELREMRRIGDVASGRGRAFVAPENWKRVED